MQPVRLIVSDLDGTLLSDSHRLTPQVCEAVQEFTEKGGLFTFATGRPFLTVKPLAEKLGIQIPFICCNGSVIAEKEKILKADHLPIRDLQDLIHAADELGITVLVFREHRIDAIRFADAVKRFEEKEKIKCHIAGSPDELPQDDIHKILLIGDMEVIKPLWSSYAARWPNRYAAFQSEHDFLEIIPGNQSKGTAMLHLMAELQMKKDQVMAIGNQMNDLDMIQYAGVGVAVANSPDELKAHADYICANGYGDGVVEAMTKFANIEAGAVEKNARIEKHA